MARLTHEQRDAADERYVAHESADPWKDPENIRTKKRSDRSNGPLDPRLLRYAAPARPFIALTACLGILTSIFVVIQAALIGYTVAPVAQGQGSVHAELPKILWLGVVTLARMACSWTQERFANRAAIRTIASLRGHILRHATAMGPRWLSQGRTADIAQLTTRGLDALDAYFVRYLPQLFMVATVTPLLLITVFSLDWLSCVTLIITIPLIPVFMILIGKMTQTYSDKRLAAMTTLGAQVLDLVAGLPTLRALGRDKGPEQQVRALSEAHARATFRSLRVAFLSGAVLELIAILSVALVAVEIGLRLIFGHLSLATGLTVLIIAPEIFAPLRAVGTHYHASADGVAAARRAFDILETPLPTHGTRPAPDLAQAEIRVHGVSVQPPGRDIFAPHECSFSMRPGTVTVLTGPNGAGKSTMVSVLLGLLPATSGHVEVDGTPLTEIEPSTWWEQISWTPQRTVLLPGTLWQNATQRYEDAPTEADIAAADEAAARVGFGEVVKELPLGWNTVIGQGGIGLSVGQRQRLALTRTMLRDRQLVILDEPTAHLDAATEKSTLAAIENLAHRDGKTVLVVAHRMSLIDTADTSVEVTSL